MQTHPFRVAGSPTTTRVPENDQDIEQFIKFIDSNRNRILAVDSENSGLNIYSKGFRCRLVQFGTETEAWVLRFDKFFPQIQYALSKGRFVAHNAPYDLLVFDHTGLADFFDLAPRTYDTYILGHLLDPRSKQEGGTGLRLKDLSEVYVDPDAPDTEIGLHKVFSREYTAWKRTASQDEIAHWAKAKRPSVAWGFANIAIDHPLYNLYAGLDVILTSRLLAEIGPLVRSSGMSDLAHWEHKVQRITTTLMRRGLRVDVDYTQRLVADLAREEEQYLKITKQYGVTNINSPTQVVAALQAMGEEWSETTDSGAPSVAKEVLLPLADLDKEWERAGFREPNPLADAIVRSKRAGKWSEAYAQAFLNLRDTEDRIHPSIKSLAARTARMSISTPPLQQLPSGDWSIRRCIIADPGNIIVAADYASMELRVLAALANVREMKRLIAAGADLHSATAELVYGDEFRNGEDSIRKALRKRVKAVGLGKIYGGGATGLARQTGIPVGLIKQAIDGYNSAYPEVEQYGKMLQRNARFGKREIVTEFGRHLPLDKDRLYSATNYAIQSFSRDIIAQALVKIEEAGMLDYVLIPVHDEIVAQAPKDEAKDVIMEIGRLMETTVKGVHIASDPTVYGPSWGSGYGCPSDLDYKEV